MAAPYVKRYPGGFLDLPTQTTPVDSAFLNAVEAALLQLLGEAPAADEVGVWSAAGGGALVYQKITNAQIAAGAAIDKSKLGALNISDADIAAAAGIAKSKLGPLNIADADIQAAAAIAISKLAGYPGDAKKELRGDGSWQTRDSVVLDDYTVSGASVADYDTNTRLGGVLPTEYNELFFRLLIRGVAVTTLDNLRLQFNGDTTGTYHWEQHYAQGGAGTAAQSLAQTNGFVGYFTAASSPAAHFGLGELTIPFYNEATAHKNWHSTSFGRYDSGATQLIYGNFGGVWVPAAVAAITRIRLFLATGNIGIGSRIQLVGRK